MKAKNEYVEYEITEADKYVKRLFPMADYMAVEDSYVMVLERLDDMHDHSMDYRYFNIDGKQYVSVFTNRYEMLKMAYNPAFEQLTLF